MRKVPIRSDITNRIVLDIIETDDGMVGIPGEFIFFRLYQDGSVEFEDLHSYMPSEHFVKHELQISKKELEEFLTNARQSDFLNSAPRYNLLERFTDMWTHTRIDFKYDGYDKQIELGQLHALARASQGILSSVVNKPNAGSVENQKGESSASVITLRASRPPNSACTGAARICCLRRGPAAWIVSAATRGPVTLTFGGYAKSFGWVPSGESNSNRAEDQHH